MKSHYAVPS